MKKTAEMVIETLLNAKGQVSSASWKSIVETSAKHRDVLIEKFTTAVVRSGIDFKKLQSVKAEFDRGERTEVQPLKWGTWLKFPYIIHHTKKSGEYNRYIRLYPSPNDNQIPKVRYFINGKEASKNEVAQYLTPSKADEVLNGRKDEVKCFNVTESNFLGIE